MLMVWDVFTDFAAEGYPSLTLIFGFLKATKIWNLKKKTTTVLLY